MANNRASENQQELIVSLDSIENHIFIIRNQKVMLDEDLAIVYGVTTKRLNEQVKRNIRRFPQDFIFQVTQEELDSMRSQIATASKRNIRYLPYVFTEHGAVMVATILNSPIAVEASIQVVRAFVKMRSILSFHQDLAQKVAELEINHNSLAQKTDNQYRAVLELIKKIIKQLPSQPTSQESVKRSIGFVESEKDSKK